MSNEALCREIDNEANRIRYALQEVGYFVQHISFRTGGKPGLIVEARAWQKGDEANYRG
jgi:hypothetical protein